MKREENPGSSQIVTLLIVGVGGYFLYNYLVSSGLWAQWFGGAAATTGGTVAQQIAAGLQTGAFVQAGTDASGNIIVHQVSNGAYYAVNPTTGAVSAASGPGQLAVGSPSTVVTTPPVTQPTTTPVSNTLTNQLQSAGAQFTQNNGGVLPNIDQWVYYYQLSRGVTLTGSQVETLIQAAGLSDATRSTPIPLSMFVNALNSVGLSGVVSVPNNGPIRAPLPTSQNFGGGYGGYGNAGRRGKYVN